MLKLVAADLMVSITVSQWKAGVKRQIVHHLISLICSYDVNVCCIAVINKGSIRWDNCILQYYGLQTLR